MRCFCLKAGLLCLALSCLLGGQGDVLHQDVDLSPSDVLDDFHDAASKADSERYFSHFTPDAIFLGTDGTERWSVDEFHAFAEPYFSQGRGWTYKVSDRHTYISADGLVAWFDEVLHNDTYGECRGTGVLERVRNTWKIAQYNLTIPVPNELAAEFVRLKTGLNTPPTTIYLVRHADKLTEPGSRDPHLSKKGGNQAIHLQHMLSGERIDAVYTTPYHRTRDTAMPTAIANEIQPIELGARASAELIERLVKQHAGQSVLVVGHSNTVPQIMKALGVEREVVLSDSDYGDLFVITLEGGQASMIRLQFSPASN